MRSGATMVVVDRNPRNAESHATTAPHDIAAPVAEAQINRQGFQTVLRDDRFIDRSADEDVWWLIVFRKP